MAPQRTLLAPITDADSVRDSTTGLALADDLSSAVRGEVRFDTGARAAYSTDASNYRQVPLGVVLPRDVDDVIAAVEVCRRHRIPITSRGGGTSLAGQACNTGVVIDFSKHLNRVTSIDPERRIATVEPGCNLDTLREKAGRHGLTFGPDPATHDRNTLGGMLGNNSCGVHSVMSDLYGPGPLTVHQVREMEVLTYDGHRFHVGPVSGEELDVITSGDDRKAEIYRQIRDLRDRYLHQIENGYPEIPRRVSGYALDWLLAENYFDVARALVGTEGTCVVILSATVELIASKPERALVVLGYPDAPSAADHVPDVIEFGPVGLEAIDANLIEYMRRKGLHSKDIDILPEGGGCLLVEFGADDVADAHDQAQRMVDALPSPDDGGPSVHVVEEPDEAEKIWAIREGGLGATAEVPGMSRTHPGWEDAAVPVDVLGSYLRDFQDLLSRYGYEAALYGHFGQGCVHCRIDFDFSTREGVEDFRRFLDEAADLVASYGGSLSGEHGDGQARGALLDKMYGEDLVEAFRRFKAIWDPHGTMNPGKVVDAHQPDQDLREDPRQPLARVKTHFAFREDDGNFAAAANRCVGVGACRDVRSGTMCPSYMATRAEEHSTRGRARLLFEMLRGDPVDDGWRSDSVREALDLCLSCKGCKSECPVNVDMATYKAEFLSHHYAKRLRPRAAYSIGLIYWWLRAGQAIPGWANAAARNKPLATTLKWLAGVAQEREIPSLSSPDFRTWFRARNGSANEEGRRVLIWPDTFNTYLDTGPARSAVRVLEAAGYGVDIPGRQLCCGRPLYDWGMLDTAERLWRRTLDTLDEELEAGTPIIGLEPSCVSAFRDELPGLMPDDQRAEKLSKTVLTMGEFLRDSGYQPPHLPAEAIVQGHCHHKAVMDMAPELALLGEMGVDYEHLDSGCCGMAGGFGFEKAKYRVSVDIGERVLLPRVRAESPTALVVADGFSCREQIRQTTERRGLHLAQVIDLALQHGEGAPLGAYPERLIDSDGAREHR